MLFLKASVLWLMFAVLAVAAGAARVSFLQPRLGEQAAHIVGTVIGSSLIFLACLGTIHWLRIASYGRAWSVGSFWLVATICFEFIFGHYVMKRPWSRLLADYNVFRGRIWILVLILQVVLPALTLRIRGLL